MTASAERIHRNATKIYHMDISKKMRSYSDNEKVVARVNALYGEGTVFINEYGYIDIVNRDC